MIIGIPSEIKNNESRVALTPSGAKELSKKGHQVYVQSDAGAGSGFLDKDYPSNPSINVNSDDFDEGFKEKWA